MSKKVFAIMTVLAISLVMYFGCESKKANFVSESSKKAPNFTLKNYDDKNISLSDYTEKIIVIEWFNYECPFVRYHYEKAKTMVNLADKYKGKNVVWLAINSTKHLTTEKNKNFAEQFQLPYPILDDRTGEVGKAYNAKTTPHMFVIDAEGNIAYAGAIDNSPLGERKEGVINYVDNALSALTGDKVVSTSKTKPYGCSVKYAN